MSFFFPDFDRFALSVAACLLFVPASRADTVIINNNFDGVANDTGPAFQQLTNGVGSGGSAVTTTGVVTLNSGSSGAASAAYGFNNPSALNVTSVAGATGFTVDWVISGATNIQNHPSDQNAGAGDGIAFNGWFFGVTNSTSATGTGLFNNAGHVIGITFLSSNFDDYQLFQGDGSTSTTLTAGAQTALGASPTQASIQDGFTLSMTINSDNTYSVTSTGLSTNFNSSGILSASGTRYANIAGSLVANTSMQGENASFTVDTVTVTAITGSTDTDPPTLSSSAIVDDQSGGPVDVGTPITYTLTFSENMDESTVEAADFGDAGGDVSLIFDAITETSPGVFSVEVTPISTGTLQFQINTGASLEDTAGNPLNTAAAIVDNTSITILNPGLGYTSPFVDTDGDSYRDEAETALGSEPNDPVELPDHTPNPAKPNVVIIYADDLGFGDISRYATLFGTPPASPTPNVDRLADQGVTFTQAHSANAVCTPSRYSLLTGKYNWRNFQSISYFYGYLAGIDNIPLDSDVTIADFLKTQGYDTSAFGKWHMGGKWYAPGTNTRITNNPTNPAAVDWTRRIEGHATDIGFDYFRGLAVALNVGPYVYLHNDKVQYWVETSSALNEYGDKLPNGRKGYFRDATGSDTFSWFTTTQLDSTVVGAKDSRASLGDPSYRQIDADPVMVADFERYIDERVAASDTDPFFAYVALHSPHMPWAITPAFNNATYGSYDYARWMAEVDHRIGRILAAIDDNGLTNNTLVIFTSDNGPESTAMSSTLSKGDDANGPLRGVKRDVWDGGTRVPFIVRWPGQAPAGMVVTDEVVSQVDIFPTVAAFLGENLPDTTAPDGESFLNVLRGQRKPGEPRGGVVLCSIDGHLALKSPDGWKLIDSTGGGGYSSTWDSDNNTISNAVGTNRGTPKQLFEMPVDLGEDNNRISGLTGDSAIRAQLVSLTGRDLLGVLDQLRTTGATTLNGREPDNDADGMSNSFETTHGLDRDSPKDAALDSDGDGADNLSESIAGTDPNDRGSVFRVIDLTNSPATLSVSWPSVSDRTYEVFWSTDLSTWTSYSSHPGTGSDITVPLDKTAIDAADGITGDLTRVFVRIFVERQ